MEIGIVGLGVVGAAIKHGFEKLGHTVRVHDLKLDTRLNDLTECEIVYLCVPTPQGADGACDTSAIEAVVAELSDELLYRGIIAIKSTVAPGTTVRLQQELSNERICHVPEFLRERVAVADFVENHDVCVIGTESDEVFDAVKRSHGDYPRQFVKLSPTEAEVAKYFNNVYNAMLITFANGFYELCQKCGADYGRIKSALVMRDHINNKYLDCNENIRGFGGVCLPKDTAAIANLVKQHGLSATLFEAIVNDNKMYETTVFEGMRL